MISVSNLTCKSQDSSRTYEQHCAGELASFPGLLLVKVVEGLVKLIT